MPQTPQSALPRPSSLIHTVYGEFVRRLGGWISIADLIALMAELDVDGPAVRSAISRLKKAGTLLQERRGATGYRLAPAVEPVFEEGDRRIFHSLEPADLADGWVVAVFSVPESARAHRHQLRSQLSRLGFGNAAPGVWLAPARLLPDARRLLERLDLSAYVHLFLSAEYAGFADLRTAVASWWDLPAIDAQYAAFSDAWRPVAQGPRTEGPAEAFRSYVPMLTRWRRLPYLDPGLPEPLLPDTWSAGAARAVFAELHGKLAEPSLRYVEKVTGLSHPQESP
ncbi:PaaX family transcriptional regulator C-terminal domain-containing protein [Streptomyces sp. NRRL WC-3742]|uniref:PaaX family transcriptional regulator n=1 Tax=Streptomyces sp. NRRL WC-3742 TaxID=1463934 RepID=UPI00055FA381|nr:PaaX family transcriptional regulator C-terminal domain-containing protein [Streptomyces sp. NRRL WC-3742]